MTQTLKKYTDWQFKGINGFHKIHTIHPYFAKYHPELPKRIIEELTSQGDVVLDPFCGSGTTLVESVRLGREAIGVDANPLGCLISEAKTIKIPKNSQHKAVNILEGISSEIEGFYRGKKFIKYEIPEFHNRKYWFTENALGELKIILGNINKINNSKFRKVARLAFSRIIVYASNQETESKYRRVDKSRKPFDIFNRFRKVLENTIALSLDFSDGKSRPEASVHNKDSRNLSFIQEGSVKLIVTSPPYLNSWDYALYHRFRFFWLGLSIRDYEDREIGKHLRTLEGRSKTDEVERYGVDMGLCLKEFSRVLKRGGYCCIVNANSIVQKKFIDTNQILIEEAKKHGLKLTMVLDRQVFGPHYGMHASLNAKKITSETKNFSKNGKTHKVEQILLFRK